MSLTRHLKNLRSPVREFLYEQFPSVDVVVKDWRSELARCDSIHPTMRYITPDDYGLVGHAIDYRVRYYFAPTPVDQLVAWRGVQLAWKQRRREILHSETHPSADWFPLITATGVDVANKWERSLPETLFPEEFARRFFSSLEAVVSQLQPVGRRLERHEEQLLARYCVVLGLFERIYRTGIRDEADSPLFSSQLDQTIDSLLSLAQEALVDDVCALSWSFYDRFSTMLSEPATLNPSFDGSRDVGGADADLIVGDCLIDIKTLVNPVRDTNALRAALYQLLGYVLLDYLDRYRIRRIGVYFARQQALLTLPVDKLMSTMADLYEPGLANVRTRFRTMAQKASENRAPTGRPLPEVN